MMQGKSNTSFMTRKELEASRSDITKEIGEAVFSKGSAESKFMSSVLFMLEGILTELEYMNDFRDVAYEDHKEYRESRGSFTVPVKVGGTD